MDRVVAVTGSAGRLGRLVVERLARDPAVDRVIAIDRVAGPMAGGPAHADHADHAGCGHAAPARVEPRALDIRDPALAGALRGATAVVHLAFVVERGSRDHAETESINVDGTRNVARCALEAGAAQLVFASSIAAYGFEPDNAGRALAEDAPLRGEASDFYYARHKAVCDRWLGAFADEHPELAVARLRPSLFLGPRGYGADTFARRVVPYVRGGDRPMHVTHEDDVADAFCLAVARGVRGAYNIAADDPLTVRELARQIGRPAVPIPAAAVALADLAWRAGRLDVDPVWIRAQMRAPIVVSSQAARRRLGWRPRYQTAGQVARALTGRPAAAASASVRLVLGGLCAITRARGELPTPDEQRHELAGLRGCANLALTGARGSEWRFEFGRGRPGAIGAFPGLAPGADATVSIAEADFLSLLGGDLTWATATMTGRLRVRGKADYGLIMGGVIAGMRAMLEAGSDGSAAGRALSWVARQAIVRDLARVPAR